MTRVLALASFVLLSACSSSTPGDASASRPPTTSDSSSANTVSTAAASGARTSSAAASSSGASTGNLSITTGAYDGVILAVSSPRELGLSQVDKVPIDGVWTPTSADVAAFEAGLEAYLTAHVPAYANGLPKKLHSYKRQWAGVTAGGKRKLYGNFFCREQPGWKESLIGVDDGGDCYFQIFYDVDTKTYVDLMVNGMG